MLRILLREFRQALRRGFGQHHAFRKFRIESVGGQRRRDIREEGRGSRPLGIAGFCEGALRGLVCFGQLRFVELRLVQRRLPFREGLEAVLLVGLPFGEILLRGFAFGRRCRLLERRLRLGDALLGAADPLALRMVHEGPGGLHFAKGLLRGVGCLLRRFGGIARFQQGGATRLGNGWQGCLDLRLQSCQGGGIGGLQAPAILVQRHVRCLLRGGRRVQRGDGQSTQKRPDGKQVSAADHAEVWIEVFVRKLKVEPIGALPELSG